jgi:hypothetical protein
MGMIGHRLQNKRLHIAPFDTPFSRGPGFAKPRSILFLIPYLAAPHHFLAACLIINFTFHVDS